MLNGDQRIQIEKQQYLSDWQQVVPSAVNFFRYTPNNMYSTILEGPDQHFGGWRTATAVAIVPAVDALHRCQWLHDFPASPQARSLPTGESAG